MYRYAARTAAGTISVAMLRPEHFDYEGRQTNPVSICRPYVARLRERGVSVKLDVVEGIKHNFGRVAFTKAYNTALAELNKE